LKGLKALGYALLLVAVSATTAIAAEGGDHGDYNIMMNFVWRVLNFIIVIGIIWWAAGKKIKNFFSSRRYNIEVELKDLDQRKEDAQKKLREVEVNIANMESERARILEDYKAQGEALKAAIIEKANAQATLIRQQAETAAQQEAKYAVEILRNEMAAKIVEAAEKILAEKLTKEEHEKLIDKYLTKVVFN
jgi:F-type H+-transporting ATPase subunit b